MAKPANDAPPRTPKPTDIQPGETQFLRYNNGFVRGKWNGLGGVAITWHSGFSTSCNADEWNDREFLDKPEKAALIDPSEIPSAHAWFHKVAEEARKNARVLREDAARRQKAEAAPPRKKFTP